MNLIMAHTKNRESVQLYCITHFFGPSIVDIFFAVFQKSVEPLCLTHSDSFMPDCDSHPTIRGTQIEAEANQAALRASLEAQIADAHTTLAARTAEAQAAAERQAAAHQASLASAVAATRAEHVETEQALRSEIAAAQVCAGSKTSSIMSANPLQSLQQLYHCSRCKLKM